ncbi:MAG: cytochrome c biogenesis CcdA family protein, partial [Rhizobiaceae bacterium]
MAVDIGYASAIGAGALSFLSPCVLPLVPPYLCYMAGVTVEDFRGTHAETAAVRAVRLPLLAASIAFVLGFSTVCVALGAGASTIGTLLRHWQQPLAIVA